jgi:hypothetical protein
MAFLKQERPKQFRYIPRFYDEAKEDLENRIKMVDQELKREKTGEYVPNLKGQFRKRHEALYGPRIRSQRSSLSRWFILLIYFGLIVAIIYLVLNIMSQLS